jgi:hypothetical protein
LSLSQSFLVRVSKPAINLHLTSSLSSTSPFNQLTTYYYTCSLSSQGTQRQPQGRRWNAISTCLAIARIVLKVSCIRYALDTMDTDFSLKANTLKWVNTWPNGQTCRLWLHAPADTFQRTFTCEPKSSCPSFLISVHQIRLFKKNSDKLRITSR